MRLAIVSSEIRHFKYLIFTFGMHFVIAGRVNCQQFVYATMIAQRLKENLPMLSYSRIAKKSGEWETWLMKTCKENEWSHSKSPIIWREISMSKGKKYYVGEVSKFLDLCQDYYGLKREMVTGELFEKAEMEWFTRRSDSEYAEDVKLKAKKHLAYRCRQVCILGAGCQACDVLIMELLHMPLQNRENGLEIRLFDESRKENKLEAIASDAKHCLGYSGLGSCRVAKNIKEALYNVDLVIVLDSFPRRANESLVKWLKRNRNAMCVLGNALNKYARKHCRVIIGSPSNQPICYNATVLASFATKLHVRNIVVVTQDLGRETLAHLAKRAKVELKDLYCPPVWGFIGLNRFVDVRRTLQNFYYKVPGPRISVNLSQGTEELEIRTVESLIGDEDVEKIFMSVVHHKAESAPRLGRIAQLAKITAILDLLKIWTLKQEGGGEIISLGVYSDGTFNIPKGLYWSQPVTMERGFWKPFAQYPIPRRTDVNLHSFFVLGSASVAQTNVRVRNHREKKYIRKPKQPKKVDLEIIGKASMPAARTQSECLALLKLLAKEELGLDFEAKESAGTIAEESEVPAAETLPLEKIYCECWRQELLHLRKIASEKSSTTEIEVDLSENLSGSEWSVVNPPERFEPSGVSVLAGDGSVSKGTVSSSTVCDCGEDCHCLGWVLSRKSVENSSEVGATEGDSAEQSYKMGETKISSEEITKEAVYEDSCKRKKVSFDSSLRVCDDKEKSLFKFYGTKEAIVDEEKRAQMMRKIKRYEREWKEEETAEFRDSAPSAERDEFEYLSQKFRVSLEGGYEIVGDPEGLEALEEIKKSGAKESAEDFTDMWTDVVTPTLQVLSLDSESTSLELSEGQDSEAKGMETTAAEDEAVGEDYGEVRDYSWVGITSSYKSNLDAIPEAESENEDGSSGETVEKDSGEKPEAAKTDAKEKRRKREGIPRCCLCHCIVPEGELGCHCGEIKVMEVFKKESVEAIQESEEEYSLRIEEEESIASEEIPLETTAKPEEKKPEIKEEEEEEMEDKKRERIRRDIFSLPPESFSPFSPKPPNTFLASERPEEMRKSKSREEILPAGCLDMLGEVKDRVMEEIRLREAEEAEKEKTRGGSGHCLAVGEELNFELHESKGVFEKSIPSAFHPVENWRNSLKKKYREWFDSGRGIRDEFYYDMAVEEVSSDECEFDKELSEYFED